MGSHGALPFTASMPKATRDRLLLTLPLLTPIERLSWVYPVNQPQQRCRHRAFVPVLC